ncbi:MAG: S8 family serine peptidase [Bryobacterales bacterium]|nr:S8 family serine peptidase [Bryobacterales bacterium]
MHWHPCYRLLVVLTLLGAPSIFAGTIPGRYIVELTTEPVAAHGGGPGIRARLQGASAASHRGRIRMEHARMRGEVEQRSASVLDTVDTVANALFIEATAAQAAEVAALPGVKRVVPMRTVHMLLDRAVIQHKVLEAWNQIGEDRAGAGIRIAIIDSGITAGHEAFLNSGLTAPDGYPRGGSTSDLSYTSGKIIVARSYVSLLPYRDPDYSVRDHVGHGTALAMIAAGGRAAGPLATITGIAPKAHLGVYKVFGTPGWNDYTSDAAIIKAIDDAVSDGMDIINLSLGSDLAPRLADDVEVEAVERAVQAGVIVVAAAGNNGPSLNTISSPATAPSVIAVGATTNDRTFAASVEVTGLSPFVAVTSSGAAPATPIVAPIVDVTTLDETGLLCSSIAGGSLSGRVALIRRGTCTFETKLNVARDAGAVGAVVYTADSATAPFGMSVGAATLPAEMISYDDAQTIRQALAAQGELWATVSFTLGPVQRIPNRLTDFTAAGPNVDLGIKPDLMAMGGDVYTATQSLDPLSSMYSSTGFMAVDGTSFSAPVVAGVAALLKGARPGLSVDQYRSLLINTGGTVEGLSGGVTGLQRTGAGLLNAQAALNSTATAYPVSLSFGAGGVDAEMARTLTVTNIGAETETFTISVEPSNELPGPVVAMPSVELAAGAAADVPVSFVLHGATLGPHEGYLVISGATTGRSIRVPYWYAATEYIPAYISVVSATTSGRRGARQQDAVLFRVLDLSGLAITDKLPEISVVSGGGTVSKVSVYDTEIPGLFGFDAALGFIAGANVFQIQAGSIVTTVTITGL